MVQCDLLVTEALNTCSVIQLGQVSIQTHASINTLHTIARVLKRTTYCSRQNTWPILQRGWRSQLVMGTHAAPNVSCPFQKRCLVTRRTPLYSQQSRYFCNRYNFSGHSSVSQALAGPCWLQLWAVLRSAGVELLQYTWTSSYKPVGEVREAAMRLHNKNRHSYAEAPPTPTCSVYPILFFVQTLHQYFYSMSNSCFLRRIQYIAFKFLTRKSYHTQFTILFWWRIRQNVSTSTLMLFESLRNVPNECPFLSSTSPCVISPSKGRLGNQGPWRGGG
jgi:hypothetical protein